MKWRLTFALTAAAMLLGTSTQASIINSADIGGLRTFQDLQTGRIWLDLNNFTGQDINEMKAYAESHGFTLATSLDVHQLLASLPNPSENWSMYKEVMGVALNKELIAGVFAVSEGAQKFGRAWATDNSTTWHFDSATGIHFASFANTGSKWANLNIWAYQNGLLASNSATPEPSTLAIWGIGLIALACRRRRPRM